MMNEVIVCTTQLQGWKASRTGKPTSLNTMPRTQRTTFESDAMSLMIDDRASACITNNLTDFVGRACHINQRIKGITGHAQTMHKGTV